MMFVKKKVIDSIFTYAIDEVVVFKRDGALFQLVDGINEKLLFPKVGEFLR